MWFFNGSNRTFEGIENKHNAYRGGNCIKSLRKHAKQDH